MRGKPNKEEVLKETEGADPDKPIQWGHCWYCLEDAGEELMTNRYCYECGRFICKNHGSFLASKNGKRPPLCTVCQHR